MSEFGNIAEGAAEALSEVTPLERGEQVIETPAVVTPEPIQAPVVPAVEQQVDLDNLPAPDLSSLDPDSRAAAEQAIRQYQSMATPKLQSAAEMRKIAEQYGGVEKIQQIAEFYQRLDTDREFARQVYNQLGTALDANGQPQQVPTAPVVNPQVETPSEFDLADLPPEIAAAYRRMESMAQDIEQRSLAEQQQRHEAEVLAQYTRDEQQILTANPHYTKADMDAIYSHAYANGGDLNAAHTYYQQVEQQILARYMQSKENVPAPVPLAGARGEIPVTTEKMTMKNVREAAIETLRNEMS